MLDWTQDSRSNNINNSMEIHESGATFRCLFWSSFKTFDKHWKQDIDSIAKKTLFPLNLFYGCHKWINHLFRFKTVLYLDIVIWNQMLCSKKFFELYQIFMLLLVLRATLLGALFTFQKVLLSTYLITIWGYLFAPLIG